MGLFQLRACVHACMHPYVHGSVCVHGWVCVHACMGGWAVGRACMPAYVHIKGIIIRWHSLCILLL